MKKVIKYLIYILIISICTYGIIKDIDRVKNINKPIEVDKPFVGTNGWLRTSGKDLLNEHGDIIQLRGISTFYIGEYRLLYNDQSITDLKNEWGINVLRIAMATDPDVDGYVLKKDMVEDVFRITDIAIKNDMYVIIDWHILNDNDPLMYMDDAIEFFRKVSDQYKDVPNIIYEICNEPNGKKVTWKKNVVPYANKVINAIRENSPKSLIIVGTPHYCLDIEKAAESPLNYDNILYSFHFYSAAHAEDYMKKIDEFRDKDLPIFVSECGMSEPSGDGITDPTKFKQWVEFLDSRNISWIYWKFSNKGESSDILEGNYMKHQNLRYRIDDYLSDSGKIIKDIFLSYK